MTLAAGLPVLHEESLHNVLSRVHASCAGSTALGVGSGGESAAPRGVVLPGLLRAEAAGLLARALQAFSRCAQQQPDNGDAWNNLAAIHLQVAHHLATQKHLYVRILQHLLYNTVHTM